MHKKTEMIILSSPYFAKARTHDMIINLNGELIYPNKAVRNLGVIFANTMNKESHVNKICQTVYIHMKNIFKKSGRISQKMHASPYYIPS